MLIRLCLLTLLLCASLFTWGQSPGAGHCLGMNGSSQYLTGNHLPAYDLDSSLTLEAWIYPTAISDNTIIGLNSVNFFGLPTGYTLRIAGNGNQADIIFETANGTVTTVGVPVRTFQWQHVALVSSSMGVFMYLNGKPVANGNIPLGLFMPSSLPIDIGRSPALSGNSYFNGELDEVRIWNRGLSQTEIRNWMCRKVTSSHPQYAHLTSYWRMDDATGTFAADLGNSSNDLLLVGAPMWGWSGAHIGDRSVVHYGGGYNLSLSSPLGDTLRVNNLTGNPDGLHLYIVDRSPNFHPATPGFAAFDTTNYYGVWAVGGNSPTMTARYSAGTNAFFAPIPACEFGLAARSNGIAPSWSNVNGSLNLGARTVTLNNFPPEVQLIAGHRNNPWHVIALPNDTACAGDSIQLAASSGAGSYQWLQGGNAIPGATSSALWSTQAGPFTLQTTGNGCTYTSNAVTLHFLPLPTTSFSTPASACIDAGAIALTGSPAGGAFSGPGTSGASFDPLSAGLGSQTLHYTYTDTLGCSATAVSVIQVLPAPTALLPAFGNYCQGAGNLVLNSGLPAGGTYFGPGVSGGMLDPFAAGLGQVPIGYLLTDANGCDDTAYANVNILPTTLTPSISVAGGTLFSSAPSGNQWYNSSGPISGATGTSYTPTATGLYYVIATDSSGCASDSSVATNIVVGIGASAPLSIAAWPNPTVGALQVAWPATAGECQLALFQLDGRRVLHLRTDAAMGAAELDLQALAPGLYLLRFQHPDGEGILRVQRLP